MGRHSILEYRDLYIGMIPNNTHWLSAISMNPSMNGHSPIATSQPFIGLIQGVQFNGQYIFEMARSGQLPNAKVNLSCCLDCCSLVSFKVG